MDIVKDIADIMKKYKDRSWKVTIDSLNLTVWIMPDIFNYDEYFNNWIKVVYEYWQFDDPYLSLKQTKKIYKEFKKNEFEFLGLSLNDLKPTMDVMAYIQNNYKAIRDTINEYYIVHPQSQTTGTSSCEHIYDPYTGLNKYVGNLVTSRTGGD